MRLLLPQHNKYRDKLRDEINSHQFPAPCTTCQADVLLLDITSVRLDTEEW